MATQKNITNNPFYTGISIPDKYFCDRVDETSKLISLIKNGNNVVLTAQRRIGKSSLIHHVFGNKEIQDNFNTLYIDLYGTKNYSDFVFALQTELLNAPFARSAKIKKDFEMMVKNLHISLGSIDPVSGMIEFPKIGITPSQLPRFSLDTLFGFLEMTKQPNIVVFDEFQQIQYYPERMAAILRSYIQKMNNTKFIFSGSSRHMLNTMFMNANQPFYKSSMNMVLDILDYDKYQEFVERCFKEYGKAVTPNAVSFTYELFLGETAPMQEVMNMVFSRTEDAQIIGTNDIKEGLNVILDLKDDSYRGLLNRIERERTRNTLYCIAANGIASNMTSSKMMKDFHLDNASSVQNAILTLEDENNPIIRKIAKGTYVIDDRMFELWIAREGHYLDIKFGNRKERMERQRRLEHPVFNPIAPK